MPYTLLMHALYRNRSKLEFAPFWLFIIPVFLGDFIITYFEDVKVLTAAHYRIDLAQFTVPYTILGFIGMFLMSAGIMMTFVLSPFCKNVGALSYIGRYSFPIFLMHPYFSYFSFIYATKILIQSGIPYNPPMFISMTCLMLALSVILPIIISKVVMRISTSFRFAGFVS
jgi:hypothetical protein